jgi:hypothetical protein
MKAPKTFELEWAFEPFSSHPTFNSRRMFGGLAAYFMDRMVLILTESPGERSYRGKNYSFEIWNGILIPTEREYQPSLQADFPSLIPHPVLGKWLYLSLEREDFEETAMQLGRLIAENDGRIGVISKKRTGEGS